MSLRWFLQQRQAAFPGKVRRTIKKAPHGGGALREQNALMRETKCKQLLQLGVRMIINIV